MKNSEDQAKAKIPYLQILKQVKLAWKFVQLESAKD